MGIRQTLNRSLVIPILSLVLVAVVSVSIVMYLTTNAQLERRVQNLAESSSVLFEDLLWQLDLETLQVLLDEYVAVGAVSGAKIVAGYDVNLESGVHEHDPPDYVYSRKLMRKDHGLVRHIGTLTLVSSREGVWQMVLIGAAGTLLIALLAVLATILIIQRLMNDRLIVPVLKVANGLDSWGGDWQEFEIDLGRKAGNDVHKEDELDRLVKSIHGMRDQILMADSIIRSKDERLLRAARIAGIGYGSYELETGRIIESDDNFAAMLGHSIEEVLGCSIRENILQKKLHVDDVEGAINIGRQLKQGGAAEGVFRVRRSKGEYRYIRQLFDVCTNKCSDVTIVRTVAQDVTEVNQLQISLLHAQKVRAIGNLTGSVAHDFNNILAVISGNLELLDRLIVNERARGYLHTSLQAVQMGAGLTQQLLAFARKQPLRPEVLDLLGLVNDSLPLLQTSVGESIELTVVSKAEAWLAQVDRTQLEAAILNLVINARDAMPDGGKLTIEVENTYLDKVRAGLHDEVTPGDYVCIAVIDDGCGMSVDTITQAMEPFFTTKGVGEGIGLGLPMAYGFARQSGGHLEVHSEQGCGTTVKLFLPRIHSTLEASPANVVSPAARAPFQGLQVFLLEDNEVLRMTFTMQLERLGCTVFSATDGQAAFALAADVSHVDLILCDVMLPNGMKGPEVVEGLQAIYRKAAVIFMSGYTERAVIGSGDLDQGVVILQKPFSMDDLVAAFAKATESTEATPEVPA